MSRRPYKKVTTTTNNNSMSDVMNYEGLNTASLNDFTNPFGFQFTHKHLTIGSSLDPLFKEPGGRRLNLSFLNDLRVPGDRFLPNGSIYARDCMRNIFALFGRDSSGTVDIHNHRTALIGSPGVGKSILCFLAALFYSRKKGAIYYRVALSSEIQISAFIIFPHQDNSVHVLFTRELSTNMIDEFSVGKLGVFNNQLARTLGISRKAYDVYVDGPLHDNLPYTLNGEYQYLCTSGGHPLPKSDGLMTLRLWILDGWTKDEAIAAFPGYKTAVKNAYALCGGNIREIILAMSGSGGEYRVRNKLDQAIERTLQSEVKLALTSTTRSEKTGDRVRTMFRKPGSHDDSMAAIHVVDSSYILSRLRQNLDLGQFVESYRFANSLDIAALKGLHFESAIHQFFENTSFDTIRFYRSTGTGAEGVAKLVSPNVYWVSSIPNFANIDSAIVYDNTLHVLQITVKKDHDFTLKTFVANFVAPVKEKVKFHRQISLHIVVPSGSPFEFEKFVLDMNIQLQQFHEENEESGAPALFPGGNLDVMCILDYVDMSSTGTLEESLRKLPFVS
jgi:hypothetical protein